MRLWCEESCFQIPTNSRAREEKLFVQGFIVLIHIMEAANFGSDSFANWFRISSSVGQQQHLCSCPTFPSVPSFSSVYIGDMIVTSYSGLCVHPGQTGAAAGVVPPTSTLHFSTTARVTILVSVPGQLDKFVYVYVWILLCAEHLPIVKKHWVSKGGEWIIESFHCKHIFVSLTNLNKTNLIFSL